MSTRIISISLVLGGKIVNRVKDLILRTYNDIGADTLEKYWGQIEYTAYWCMHLLLPNSNVLRVIPEGVEDVVIDRGTFIELHQVKCRDESQPPWTTAEVLPILCNQYSKRYAFDKECEFHFVSDHMADTKTSLRTGSYGSLQRLKQLLEIFHLDGCFSTEELGEFDQLKNNVIPRIVDLLSNQDDESVITYSDGIEFLNKTYIDTNSKFVRDHPDYSELNHALQTSCPDMLSTSFSELDRIYQRLILLIIYKILHGDSLDDRAISKADVIHCRYEPTSVERTHPGLDELPGRSVIEKKAIYGGFDLTEIPIFTQQYFNAKVKSRQLSLLGFEENVDDLSLALIAKQNLYRRQLSEEKTIFGIGPHVYQKIQQDLPTLIETYFPNVKQADEVFGLGLLWKATDECILWWECFHIGD